MSNLFVRRFVGAFLLLVISFSESIAQEPQNGIEQKITATTSDELVRLIANKGDARRGALLFHSSAIGCGRCHSVSNESKGFVGPNLALWKKAPQVEELIESVLFPSKKIDSKYQVTKFLKDDGSVIAGIVLNRDQKIVQVGTGADGKDLVEITLEDIESESISPVSMMPNGQLQLLASVDQFYDLVAYLEAIAKGGVEEATRLQPTADQLKLRLPEYESRIDHAGMIREWNDKSLKRGEAVYKGLCVNCHGTLNEPGSLPTALRFGRGAFKKGADPYSMYQTLTHGSGLMLPQTWMVPQQKYDVIHYIREQFLKSVAPDQYVAIDKEYLSKLPTGDTRGPKPVKIEPWRTMDYGPMMTTTIEIGNDGSNIAQKAIAFRLDDGPGGISQGRFWAAFEHDTMRWSGAWSGKDFSDWESIQFNGHHGIHPHVVGDVHWANPTGPGWANPETGEYEDDQRVVGRDGKRYGPLPKEWAKYRGLVRNKDQVVLHYTVGTTNVYESAFGESFGNERYVFGRCLDVGPRQKDLKMLIATLPSEYQWIEADRSANSHTFRSGNNRKEALSIAIDPKPKSAHVEFEKGRVSLVLPAGDDTVRYSIRLLKQKGDDSFERYARGVFDTKAAAIFSSIDHAVQGQSTGKSGDSGLRNPEVIATTPRVWYQAEDWVVDDLSLPMQNPWAARVRVTGVAFYPDRPSLVVCTWDGDIWRADGLDSLDQSAPQLKWRRIASGLYQPLGIYVLPDCIMATCRDQLMRLVDVNDDGEMDRYECFNSDHQVTEHFHEFAMGLQRDDQGNWYYAKSARHALPAVVPHHGTLLKVSKDGASTEIVANGFRAANGVCMNGDGSFIVTDQEGHWNPKNRINWVHPGKFYGNMFGYHDIKNSSDDAMEQPLCWITNAFDRSPAEPLYVTSEKWGSLKGALLNLSYGYGRIYTVPFEKSDERVQGGMCALPIPDLPTGIIRGRFSPYDGQLYVGGMFAWASSRQEQEGGLYRVRYLGDPVDMPVHMRCVRRQDMKPAIEIDWSDRLDPQTVSKTNDQTVTVWGLKRSQNYGSDHIDEHTVEVESIKLSQDGKTLTLIIPELKPTWCVSLKMKLINSKGKEVNREIHGTINWIK